MFYCKAPLVVYLPSFQCSLSDAWCTDNGLTVVCCWLVSGLKPLWVTSPAIGRCFCPHWMSALRKSQKPANCTCDSDVREECSKRLSVVSCKSRLKNCSGLWHTNPAHTSPRATFYLPSLQSLFFSLSLALSRTLKCLKTSLYFSDEIRKTC